MKPTAPVVQIKPRLLSPEAAAAYLGDMSISTLEALVRSERLARPRQISAGRVAFALADLDAYADTCPPSSLKPGPGRYKAAQGAQPIA